MSQGVQHSLSMTPLPLVSDLTRFQTKLPSPGLLGVWVWEVVVRVLRRDALGEAVSAETELRSKMRQSAVHGNGMNINQV